MRIFSKEIAAVVAASMFAVLGVLASAGVASSAPIRVSEVTPNGPTASVLHQFMALYRQNNAAGVGLAACAYGPLYSKGPNDASRLSKVLDVRAWGTGNRSETHLWSFRTTGNVENQRWFMCTTGETWNGSPVATIENSNASGKCLDKSEDQSDRNGTAVYIYECHGGANQRWAVVERSDGFFELRNMATDDGVSRYLDISRFQWFDGAKPIWMWSRTGNWNQAWE